MTFSKVEDWEGDAAVKQMLMFANEEAQRRYEDAITEPGVKHTPAGWPDQNGLGALFKIRAVKNGHDGWDAVVRCGTTGAIVTETQHAGREWQDAMRTALADLGTHLQNRLLTQMNAKELKHV